MTYQRGDVVFGYDPFNDREAPRPWLIISNDRHPFQGEQYIAATITSKSYHDGFMPLASDDWVRGGMPANSSVVPWGIASPNHDDLDHDRYQGKIRDDTVDAVAQELTTYLGFKT